MKYFFAFVLCLCIKTAFAQKDTLVYYLKNSGKVVSAKDSADYFLVILPPDTSVDKNLSVINGFYPNGKLKLLASSLTNDLPLKLQGQYREFFPNGHKRMVRNFDNGALTGDIIQYYPNGRFYNKKSYVKTITEETELQFIACSDSTGKVLAQNGNGDWITYNNDFTREAEKGEILNGQQDSIWTITESNNISYKRPYKNGKIIPSEESVPEFPGGVEAFYKFIIKNLRYPNIARRNGTQGRVIVRFVLEKDGTLTGVKVAKGIGDGCDEEAVRIIKLSPPWKPGMQNGKPVRVEYSVPISFSLN